MVIYRMSGTSRAQIIAYVPAGFTPTNAVSLAAAVIIRAQFAQDDRAEASA
jgi:hypothetical protein